MRAYPPFWMMIKLWRRHVRSGAEPGYLLAV